jgi:hypothetical protein
MAGGLIDSLFVGLGFKIDDKELDKLDINQSIHTIRPKTSNRVFN